jgi:PKD repeat protein
MSANIHVFLSWIVIFSFLFFGNPTAAQSPTGACPVDNYPYPLVLDGASLLLCMPVKLDTFFVADPIDAFQTAAGQSKTANLQVLIEALPYGAQPPADDFPAVKGGSAPAYVDKIKTLWAAEGKVVQAGPVTHLFSDQVSGFSTQYHNLNNLSLKPHVVETTWVTEAGQKVWLINVTQDYADPVSSELIRSDLERLSAMTLTSPDQFARVSRPEGPPPPSDLQPLAPSAPQDLPAPSWWSGDCNVNNHPGSYALGGSYLGVKACGPIHTNVLVNFGAGVQQREWQCAELSKRYLYLAYGIAPYSAHGKDVVWNYSGSKLEKISNGTAGKAPKAGDVISYSGPTVYGHTGIVSAASVDGNGNGSITVIEQNANPNGIRSHTVSNWTVQSSMNVTGWLHDPGSQPVCSAPGNGLPRDTAVLNNGQVTFTWTPPSCQGIDYYTFRVGDHPNLDSGPWIINESVGKDASSVTKTIGSQYFGKTLYWAIWAHNAAGYSPKGGEWTFKIDTSVPPTPPPLPVGTWNVQYFRNKELNDQCASTSYSDTFVFLDWGEGAPVGGCNSDNWSARLTRQVNFQGGRYDFAVFADDWGRLYVDGYLVVNSWNGASQHYEGYNVSGGTHEVKIEFADTLGGAKIQSWWWGPGFDIPRESQDPNQWYANYWLNSNQWSDAFVSVNEGTGKLVHSWGDGSPGWDMPSNNFSAKFRRTVFFECGLYHFVLNHDDGARFWVDEVLKVDRWSGAIGNYPFDLNMERGNRQLRVDYYENGGGANVSLDWQMISGCAPGAPGLSTPANAVSLAWNTSVTLTWNASAGATQYFATLQGGPGVNLTSDWTTGTSWQLGALPSGTYTWGVTASNAYGSSSPSTYSFTIQNAPVIPPTADFDTAKSSGATPLTVVFHNLSSGSFSSCSWTFGDGQSDASCEEYVSHTYTTKGIFTVSLGLSGSGGNNTKQRTNYVNTNTGQSLYIPLAMKGFASQTGTWVSLTTEGFEEDFPGTWTVSDRNLATNGTGPIWDDRSCRAGVGGWSGWAVGGRNFDAPLTCGSNYPDQVDTWMIRGPFDLSAAGAAELRFKLWLNTESGFDFIDWGASSDGSTFSWVSESGNSNGWVDRSLSLSNVNGTNFVGKSQVWIAFRFHSDSSINAPEGAFVDDILLRKCSGGSCN